MVCAGAVFAAFSISFSISAFDIGGACFAAAPLSLFFAVWIPKLARTPVKTLAMKVGSMFSEGS